MYTLLVCGDLYGQKVNLELSFANMPTIAELQRKIVEVFDAEQQSLRPSGYPAISFNVARLQIYDDVLLKWADLVTCTQLHEYDQLYVFQPQSPWHIDVQKDLPPPRPPMQLMPSGSIQNSMAYGGGALNSSSSTSAAAAGANNLGGSSGYNPHNSSAIGAVGGGSGGGGSGGSFIGARGDSPARDRLAAQQAREAQLRAELERTHQETMRLEAEARAEEDAFARRSAAEQEQILLRKEQEIARQRAALQAAEDEYRRQQAALGRR